MRQLRAFAGTLLLLLTSAPAPAQQKPPAAPEPDPIFGEEIDVRVVNVEMVVTDPQGNRVSGLKASDFRLRVDGQEVPVSFFTEVRDRQSVAAGETGAGAATEPVGTNYLVFVDDYFTNAPRRNEVLEALQNDLARLGPADRMAIVAYDGGRMSSISNWTGSRDELARAFDAAMKRPAGGLDRVSEYRSLLGSESFLEHFQGEQVPQVAGEGGAGSDPLNNSTRVVNAGLTPGELAFGRTMARQVEDAVSAAVGAMRAAGSPQGRKVMLLLSGGWPYSIQSFLSGSESVSPSRELPDGEDLFRPLASTANLLGYTLYPVDVPGIETTASDAAVFGQQDLPGRSLREQEIHGSLEYLAKETGGRPILNTLRTAVLDRAEEDTRSYYWLGFTPTWQRNDQRHAIQVEVLRPGLTARYRSNFLDLSRKAETTMALESALLFGTLPGARPMPVRLGTPTRRRGEVEIPMTLALPVDALTTVPVDQPTGGTAGVRYRAQLELRVVVADDKGGRSEIPMIPLNLSADKQPRAGGYVKYELKIKVNGDPRHLLLATYDPLSGKIATAQVDVPKV